MILTVGNTKGGVGKTTLAVQIAISRARAGRDVWLIDGDRQATAVAAVATARMPDGSQGLLVRNTLTALPCEVSGSAAAGKMG